MDDDAKEVLELFRGVASGAIISLLRQVDPKALEDLHAAIRQGERISISLEADFSGATEVNLDLLNDNERRTRLMSVPGRTGGT